MSCAVDERAEVAPVAKPLSRQELEATLTRLAPFHHAIDLPFGLSTHLPEASRQDRERTRLKNLMTHAWPTLLESFGGSLEGLRVLDVACNCGGFSVEAARAGASYVLGIDIEDRYLEQANFIKDALELDNVEYLKMRLEELDPAVHGRFDVAFCFGILYHLENPVLGMQRIAGVVDTAIIVDTTLMKLPVIDALTRRWPLWHMRRVPGVDDSARNISTSRWRKSDYCQFSPNLAAVKDLLGYIGFDDIDHIKPTAKGLEARYYNGRRVSLLARRREQEA